MFLVHFVVFNPRHDVALWAVSFFPEHVVVEVGFDPNFKAGVAKRALVL